MPTFNLTEESDVSALHGELSALGSDALISRIRNSPQIHGAEEDSQAIARAFDHLRNKGDASREIHDARDSLLMRLNFTPLTYRLRSWQFNSDEQDQIFWSYTGPYSKGGRLVNGAGDELKVFSVEHEATTLEPGVLVVVRW